MNISFIGGGNMATALISGLKKSARTHLSINVTDPNDDARNHLNATYGVRVFTDSARAIKDADVIVLAVKPQVMPEVLENLAGSVHSGQLVLSIAAGTTIASIIAAFGPDHAVIRSMPNIPALIGFGITGICAGPNCHAHHLDQAETILSAIGEVVWIEDESLMDVVTAISGCGPAYYFYLTESLANAGTALGLPTEVAERLAAHTAHGAGAMVDHADVDVVELRRRVTSPAGATEAAIEKLEQEGHFMELVHQAVEAATRRGHELAMESGDDKT
jgi:pyrroline-5-carboxylate reductase